jgi:hypothetical protein
VSPKAALLVTLEVPTGALTSSQRPNAGFALTIRQGDVLVAQAQMSLLVERFVNSLQAIAAYAHVENRL